MESELFSAMVGLTRAHAAGDPTAMATAMTNMHESVLSRYVYAVWRVFDGYDILLGLYDTEGKADDVASDLRQIQKNRYRVDRRLVE